MYITYIPDFSWNNVSRNHPVSVAPITTGFSCPMAWRQAKADSINGGARHIAVNSNGDIYKARLMVKMVAMAISP